MALARGAEVVATDHYTSALDFTVHNARTNTGREPETVLLDWHSPEVAELGTFDLVLAADVLYERRNALALADLIPELLARGGEVILADPRRGETLGFLNLMKERGFRVSTESVTVEQGGREVEVLLHVLRP